MNAATIAEEQYGLITRAQAREAGMSDSAVDRRLKSGAWIALWPGVYRLSGAPVTDHQRAMAATLRVEGAVVSHTSAGRLLRLDGVPDKGLHVTVRPKSGVRAKDVSVHRATLTRLDRVVIDGIPATSASRTLVDCASLLDGERLEAAFEHARRMGLTSIDAVKRHLGRGRPGSSVMRDVLAHAETRPKESRLEVKTARLLRSSPLPKPVTQLEIGAFRVDFAWPPFWVVCECDGFAWHGHRLQWKRDRRRIAAIEQAGWRVVHVTWDDVTKHPSQTVERLAGALRRAA